MTMSRRQIHLLIAGLFSLLLPVSAAQPGHGRGERRGPAQAGQG